ncbi:hypothetical protein J4232_00610, partial [Candidatus Woesearchaeota archaeon]|nr:hypothetical protein [Candidatus Woesearchaeota archaeon]
KNYETDLLIANNGEGIGVSIIPKQNSFYSLIMHPDLVDSMFNRMFFYSGHELACFDSFDYVKQVSGGEVFTWKVDWNCTDKIKVFSPASCGAFNNKKGIFTLKNGSQQSCGVLNPFFLNKKINKKWNNKTLYG